MAVSRAGSTQVYERVSEEKALFFYQSIIIISIVGTL